MNGGSTSRRRDTDWIGCVGRCARTARSCSPSRSGYHGGLDAAVLGSPARRAETYVLDRSWRWQQQSVTGADFGYLTVLRSARALWVGELPAITVPDLDGASPGL